jgi:hypothetical protein
MRSGAAWRETHNQERWVGFAHCAAANEQMPVSLAASDAAASAFDESRGHRGEMHARNGALTINTTETRL